MTVLEGIEIAKKNLIEVLPEMAHGPLQLEELETPPYASRWRFTFSTILAPANTTGSLAEVLRSRRIAKQVEIDTESGSLVAVKNTAA